MKLKLEERRNSNEHEEKFDDGDLSDSDFGSQPSLIGGLIAADVVKSNSSATCSGGQASVTGSAEIVGLVAAGQSVLVSTPNLAISSPGGISLIVNEQTSSSGGNTGSMTVNALHVKGPSIEIVVASAQSGITCS